MARTKHEGSDGATRKGKVRPSLPRILTIAGVAGMAVVLVATALVCWNQWSRVVEFNENKARDTAFFLGEHASRLFEVSDLALLKTEALVAGKGWDEVQASRRVFDDMVRIRDGLPHIDDLWLNDASGKLRSTTFAWPTPVSGAGDRADFAVHRDGEVGFHVGGPDLGKLTRRPMFMVSRGLRNPDGSFGGVAFATLSPSYFLELWSRLTMPDGMEVVLFRRDDQSALARFPVDAGPSSFNSSLDAVIAASPEGGTYAVDDEKGRSLRHGAFARVGKLPVYVMASLPRDVLVGSWVRSVRWILAFSVATIFSLACLTLYARHQASREVRDRRVLEDEVRSRTASLLDETRALETVNRASRRLSENLDLDTIVQTSVDAGSALAGASVGAFLRPDAGGIPPLLLSVLSGSSVLRSDEIPEGVGLGSVLPPSNVPLRSLLALPVVSRSGEVHGALVFADPAPHAFTDRHERMLGGIAAQAAVALDNARLFEKAQLEIEARKETERRQKLLIREMHHRVKNSLATVKALATLSLRTSASLEEFGRSFSGRLAAMGQTHTLLTDTAWQAVPVRDLLTSEFGPYMDAGRRRVVLTGPEVVLGSDQVVPLGMAIHEMTTNAVKYGALSVQKGSVHVHWSLERLQGRERFEIVWVESGGPVVGEPTRKGFGSTLLDRVLAVQLSADVSTKYAPEGACYRIGFDLVACAIPSESSSVKEQAENIAAE